MKQWENVWKTMRVGDISKDVLLAELAASGCVVHEWWAGAMLRAPAFTVADAVEDLELVQTSVAALAASRAHPTTMELWMQAMHVGLVRCPAEVALRLAIALSGHLFENPLFVAMEGLMSSSGSPGVFVVGGSGDVTWLGSDRARLEDRWYPEIQLVFARARTHHDQRMSNGSRLFSTIEVDLCIGAVIFFLKQVHWMCV